MNTDSTPLDEREAKFLDLMTLVSDFVDASIGVQVMPGHVSEDAFDRAEDAMYKAQDKLEAALRSHLATTAPSTQPQGAKGIFELAKECGAKMPSMAGFPPEALWFTPEGLLLFSARLQSQAIAPFLDAAPQPADGGKDAERYQWLRKHVNRGQGPVVALSGMGCPGQNELFDQAIDAAILANKGADHA